MQTFLGSIVHDDYDESIVISKVRLFPIRNIILPTTRRRQGNLLVFGVP